MSKLAFAGLFIFSLISYFALQGLWQMIASGTQPYTQPYGAYFGQNTQACTNWGNCSTVYIEFGLALLSPIALVSYTGYRVYDSSKACPSCGARWKLRWERVSSVPTGRTRVSTDYVITQHREIVNDSTDRMVRDSTDAVDRHYAEYAVYYNRVCKACNAVAKSKSEITESRTWS